MSSTISSHCIQVLIFFSLLNVLVESDSHNRELTTKSFFKNSNRKENNMTDSDTNLHLSCNNNNPWPKLNLFLTAHISEGTTKKNALTDMFLRSLLLFWPMKQSNSSLTIIFDEEKRSYNGFAALYKNLNESIRPKIDGGLNIYFNQPYSVNLGGHDRQQLLMFWADNFTDTEFVGFVDTDCVFITYIDREDLFEGGKPVINGRIGVDTAYSTKHYDFWTKVPQATSKLLGYPEPMRCVSYFPVIIRTAHLKEMREFLSKKFSKNFDTVFFDHIMGMYGKFYSQFNIMCAYLFYFHKDDYVWYVHPTTPKWNGISPPPLQGQNGNMTLYTPEMLNTPKPRIAVHARYKEHYIPIDKSSFYLNELLKEGICYSPPFPRREPDCEHVKPYEHWGEMHSFEGFDWAAVNSKERLNEQMRLRYQRIRNCSKEWSFKTIKSIFKLPGNLPPSSGGSGSSSGSSSGGSNSSGFSLTKSKGVYIFLP